MILYNTLSRKKEEFKPIADNTARIYSCGPTVYRSATIGNLRAYIFVDILKKSLQLDGIKINDVMNITDVGHLTTDADTGDDKMESSAKKLGLDPQAIAKKYTEEFLTDCRALNIRDPKKIAPATLYIKEMIDFVKTLEKKGFTYKTSDGIYFDASKFPNYTSLSGTVIEKNKGGARIDLGEKKNINDFALWKFCGENVIQKWPSPWGVGCPGWHIECSTIALKHLGESFDIHTGGIDLIPTHHTNEIAQTESLTGKKMCNFWCHNEFMTVDNGKMSKSLGNAFTLTELKSKGFSPMIFRYFVLLANYRTILNFTFEGLKSSQNAYNNLLSLLAKHRETPCHSKQSEESNTALSDLFSRFADALTDDLNTPKAIAILWEAAKLPASGKVYDLIIKMDKTLSLDLAKNTDEYLKSRKSQETANQEIPSEIFALADARLAAKKAKDFAKADRLRAEITSLGYDITDTKEGYNILKRSV